MRAGREVSGLGRAMLSHGRRAHRVRRKGAKFISRFNKRAEIAFGKGQSGTGRPQMGPIWDLAR